MGYDRIEVQVETTEGPIKALTYVGLPNYIDHACLPTQRYLNIIIQGAIQAKLSDNYIHALRKQPVQRLSAYPPFQAPTLTNTAAIFDGQSLAAQPFYTAMLNAVFDMQNARKDLQCLHALFGGKDTTLFHLRRHDTSHGQETLQHIYDGDITASAREYLNAYLHEYNNEFLYVGSYESNYHTRKLI